VFLLAVGRSSLLYRLRGVGVDDGILLMDKEGGSERMIACLSHLLKMALGNVKPSESNEQEILH
jgi:hypothetical protein